MTNLEPTLQNVNIDLDYDPYVALEGCVAKLIASEDPNPPAGFELDEKYQKWLYSEADKFSRGEPSVVFRRDANVIWLPSRSPSTSGFIIEFFISRIDAPICVTALPNERGKGAPVTIYTRDVDEIAAFVKDNDRPGWAVYFSVNPVLEGKKRNKENMAAIVVLHADLDYKGIVQGHAAILKALKHLPVPPSLIVSSGHGLHCYWLLSTVMQTDETDRVEDCLKQIARVLAGDPAVCEIARIMRLPGSHNSKDDGWLDVHVVGERGPDYDFDDLEKWFCAADPILTRVAPIEKEQKAGNGHDLDPESSNYDPWERYGIDYKDPIDPDVELGLMQYHDSSGHGIDRTQLRVIGHYIAQGGYDLDRVIDYIVAKTFEVVPESVKWHAGNRAAAEREEVNKLRDMCVRTYRKFPQHIEKQTNWPEWARTDGRLKKLLNGHRETVSGPNVVQFPAATSKPAKKPEKVLPRLKRISNKDLRRELLEHVSWVVDKIFVAGAVNGLFGEGAVGKDQLLYQLALAWTSGAKWLGIDVPTTWNGEPIRVLWFPVEDPKKELRRRQHNIETYYAQHDEVFDPQDDNLQIIPQLGEETVIAIYDHQAGKVKPTDLYTQMCTEIDDFKPHVVIVGNRVNIFAVNQNDDAQARQCINLLNHICVKYGVTVIMPAHPSQTGKNTGSGESGSVQWNNGVRQRVYISKQPKEEKGEEPVDKDVRQIEVMKSNWAASGETLTMKWTAVIDENGECYGGVFVEDQVVQVKKTDESGMPKSDAQIKAEEAQLKAEESNKIDADFMRYFDQLMQMGLSMRPDPNSRSGPATLFTTLSECKYKSKKGKALMRDAMMRLLAKGVIKSVPDKPKWKNVMKLVRGVDENGKVFQI